MMLDQDDIMRNPKQAKHRTENEMAAEALRESEHRFRVLAQTMPAAIFVYQGDKYVYVNPEAEKITGYSREELLGMNFWDWVSPEYQETIRDRGRARQRGEKVVSRYEVKYRTKDGREGWADFAAGLIEYGGKPAVIGVAFDITKRKRAEKALKKSQYILSKAQEISHVGNWAWDLSNNGIQWSDEIFRIFGYRPQELQPTYEWLLTRIFPDDRELMARSVDAAVHVNKLFNIDFRIITTDGSIHYLNIVADRIKNDRSGTPEWIYGIIQDITGRKQIENQLRDAQAQAELYVDLMGHDINNMNMVALGFLEMADDRLSSENRLCMDDRPLLRKAIENIKNSSMLIDNVRKLQRERAGEFKIKAIDLTEVLASVKDQYLQVPGRDVKISFNARCRCVVFANDLLRDVFSNLVGNSIKHSSGPLTININLDCRDETGIDFCKVAVEDNGPGIPDAMKAIIFDRSHTVKKLRGKGLGLYIVNTLVADFHGKVWAEDRVPGDHTKGTRIVVMLPAVR